MTPEHIRYADHVAACEATEHGRWCNDCHALIRDADAADFRRPTEPVRAAAAARA